MGFERIGYDSCEIADGYLSDALSVKTPDRIIFSKRNIERSDLGKQVLPPERAGRVE